MEYRSQITFMYFNELLGARHFFEEVLGLEVAFDPGWAIVYKVLGGAYLGAVSEDKGSISGAQKGGTLVSLTVEDVTGYYERIKSSGYFPTEIKEFEDIGVRSFFFKGPEGYDFEIQMFYRPMLDFQTLSQSLSVGDLLDTEREFCEKATLEGAAGWASYFETGGAMISKSGTPIMGVENIKRAMSQVYALNALDFKWMPMRAEVSLDETMGYTYGNYTRRYIERDGTEVNETGMYMTVWRKQADGSWKIVVDGGN